MEHAIMNEQKKVLVIDDNPEIREIISSYLQEKNCQIFTLSDGELGPKVYHDENIDLLICDMVMPVLWLFQLM
jgi:two-component system OmpR family response regulator